MSKTLSEQLAEALAELDTLRTQAAESASALVAANDKLAGVSARLEKAEADLAAALANGETLTSAVAALTKERDDLKATATSAERQAANIAAAVGVPPVAADKGSESATGDDIDSLRAQLAKEIDPVKKGLLVKRIRALNTRS